MPAGLAKISSYSKRNNRGVSELARRTRENELLTPSEGKWGISKGKWGMDILVDIMKNEFCFSK